MTEEDKPLTREDVLRLIEEHGGPKGVDLSGRNLRGIDLSSHRDEPPLDLSGIILEGATLEGGHLEEARLAVAHLEGAVLDGAHLEGAGLWYAHLEGATLRDAHLEGAVLDGAHLERARLWRAHLEGALLRDAHLEGASLWYARLEGAGLYGAHLEGARLLAATFSPHTVFERADWGSKYIVGEEVEKDFRLATVVYRTLKQWHTNAGMYDRAGEFYFREMTVRRKALKWGPNPIPRAWSKLVAVLCGYGEKPIRVVGWAVVVVLGMGAIYSASALTFPSSLYYSAVSFTALGYGLWVPTPEGWVKGLGAFEAFIGVFMMALFLVTFVRKMVR